MGNQLIGWQKKTSKSVCKHECRLLRPTFARKSPSEQVHGQNFPTRQCSCSYSYLNKNLDVGKCCGKSWKLAGSVSRPQYYRACIEFFWKKGLQTNPETVDELWHTCEEECRQNPQDFIKTLYSLFPEDWMKYYAEMVKTLNIEDFLMLYS